MVPPVIGEKHGAHQGMICSRFVATSPRDRKEQPTLSLWPARMQTRYQGRFFACPLSGSDNRTILSDYLGAPDVVLGRLFVSQGCQLQGCAPRLPTTGYSANKSPDGDCPISQLSVTLLSRILRLDPRADALGVSYEAIAVLGVVTVNEAIREWGEMRRSSRRERSPRWSTTRGATPTRLTKG